MPRRVAQNLLDDDNQEDNREDPRRRAAADDNQPGDEDEQEAGDEDEQEAGDEDEQEAGDEQPDDESDNQDDEARERARRRAPRARGDDIEELRTRAERAEQLARDTQTRVDALTRQPTPQQPTETPEQEAARMALMSPSELIDYRVNKAISAQNRITQAAILSTSNAADKASFDQFVASQPVWKKLAPDVERKHAELVAKGEYPTRQTVLTWLLGERALKLAQGAGKENAQRRQRVDRQQTRPMSGRSDVQSERRGGRSLEDRLANVQL